MDYKIASVGRAFFPGGKCVLTGHNVAGQFVVGVVVKPQSPASWMRQGVTSSDRQRVQAAADSTHGSLLES